MELFRNLLHKGLVFVYFAILPLLLLILLSWGCYSFAQEVFYDAEWCGPLLLLLSVFLAGVISRQTMGLHRIGGEGMVMVLLLLLAHVLFAYLTYRDLQLEAGVYSALLPKPLSMTIYPCIFGLPIVALLGMVFAKNFSLVNP